MADVKTIETREIFVFATALDVFLTRGIYQIDYRAITDATSGALGSLKKETFGRWMRNPLFRRVEVSDAYMYRYGMRPKMFGTPASDFGLELVFNKLGSTMYVKWLRMWTSHFQNGEKANNQERQDTIEMISLFVKDCRKRWAVATDKAEILTELTEEFEQKILPKCCEYRGNHGILYQEPRTGRKTTIRIPRTRIKAEAIRRITFKQPDCDVLYV